MTFPLRTHRYRGLAALTSIALAGSVSAQTPRPYHLSSTPETVYRGFFPRNAKPALTVPSGAIVEIDTLSHQGLNSLQDCTPGKGDLTPGECRPSGALDPIAFQAQQGIS